MSGHRQPNLMAFLPNTIKRGRIAERRTGDSSALTSPAGSTASPPASDAARDIAKKREGRRAMAKVIRTKMTRWTKPEERRGDEQGKERSLEREREGEKDGNVARVH